LVVQRSDLLLLLINKSAIELNRSSTAFGFNSAALLNGTTFCVLRIKARGHRDLVAVVGHTATIAAGEWVTASGEWINDRTHGQQRAINALTFTASSSVHLAVGRTIILKLSFSRCGASVMSTARCA
jgi:hypothetical protein